MSPHHCPEQQVQYPNASWACPYRCSLGFPNSQGQYCIIFPPGLLLPQPMSKTMVDPDIHTSSLTHKSQGSPVVLMTWSYLLLKPHLPVIPLLRFLASFICIVFHQSRSSFRFSKPGSLSAPASVHSVPFSQTALFLITPLTLCSWSILGSILGSQLQCIYLLGGFPDHPSLLLCAPMTPLSYPSLSHSLAVVLNKR